jgi:hypothetical protein
MMSLALLACGSALPEARDRVGLVEALQALPDAHAVMAICRDLSDSVRFECVIAAVEAAPRDQEAPEWCDLLTGSNLDECRFQLAERTRDLAGCARAGAYADDCRLHVFSELVPEIWPKQGDFAAGVTAVRSEMLAVGIAPDDYRFWSAAFRHGLLARRPFDRQACSVAGDPALVDACRHTGLAVYQDLLNHERDFGHFPCDGAPLPETLAHTADPDLDAIIAERRPRDLCRGLQ